METLFLKVNRRKNKLTNFIYNNLEKYSGKSMREITIKNTNLESEMACRNYQKFKSMFCGFFILSNSKF